MTTTRLSEAVRLRHAIATRVAEELHADAAVAEVWLEGALADGLAHPRSDIDLHVLTDVAEPPVMTSRLVDGVRVDPTVSAGHEVETLRALLVCFQVWFEDVEQFRRVRQRMGALTRLRTALRCTATGWQPVLDAHEQDVYRQWAVADRTEQVLSLSEDLLGLLTAGMHDAAEIVWWQLTLALAAVECAAYGQPLLGDKWLPALRARTADTVRPDWHTVPEWGNDDWSWFLPVQRQLTEALLTCWPLTTRNAVLPPSGTTDVGWLPQRYADGWFLRRGDERIPVSESQLRGWYPHVYVEPREGGP